MRPICSSKEAVLELLTGGPSCFCLVTDNLSSTGIATEYLQASSPSISFRHVRFLTNDDVRIRRFSVVSSSRVLFLKLVACQEWRMVLSEGDLC